MRVQDTWGLRCPNCARDDALDVQITAWARLTGDGTDSAYACDGAEEWTDTSPARCCACDHVCTVADCRIVLQFRDLAVGDTFDFINDACPQANSFFKRCVKRSKRGYYPIDEPHHWMHVGTINCRVFHVEKKQP